MNLHKTLKAYNEAELPTGDKLLLSEAKNILDNAEANDINALSFLGMDKNIKAYNKKQKEISDASPFDEVYDISVIKKMAINYGLRFLPSNYYRGTIDPLLPSIVNAFVSKYKISVEKVEPIKITSQWRHSSGEKESRQFYILAPAESFGLEERPKDPIIFYKINENKYAFIHKWGNDLSSRRYLANIPFRNTSSFCKAFALLVVSVCTLIFIISGSPAAFVGLTTLIICLFISMEYEGNEGNWNSKYK